MSGDEPALLAAIAAAPADDLPRLVYADWIEERGRADQAAFIRQQIAAAADPGGRSFVRIRASQFGTHSLADLAAIKPWERGAKYLVTPLLVIAGGREGYERCVAWHRGFPVIVGCAPRSWHLYHHLFTLPIDGLCLYGLGGGEWGIYPTLSGWRLVSRVCPGIDIPWPDSTWQYYPAAFTNVRRQFGRCTAALLSEFCVTRFEHPLYPTLPADEGRPDHATA